MLFEFDAALTVLPLARLVRATTSSCCRCWSLEFTIDQARHNITSLTHFRSSSPAPTASHLKQSHTMSSLDPPTYLTSIQNNIRARPISWEGAVRAKTITDEDLKKIKSIDKVRKEQRKQTIEADVDSFVTLLLGGQGSQSIFEAAAKRQDIIHYMLVLLGDIVDGTKPQYSHDMSHGALILV